jgi:hypothetical protein
MDDRLAGLRHEIDRIMSAGPIGRWSNPPTTFAMMSETAVFNADGSGVMTSRSGMMGTSTTILSSRMASHLRIALWSDSATDLVPDGNALVRPPLPSDRGRVDFAFERPTRGRLADLLIALFVHGAV